VTKIDTMNRPGRSMFQLDFPEPLPLHDQAKHLLYSKRKTWSLLDLPGASSPDTRPVIPQHIFPGEMPGEIEPGFDWLMLAVGMIVLAIIASIAFLWRRHKRRQVM
jgi:hypothetical protein